MYCERDVALGNSGSYTLHLLFVIMPATDYKGYSSCKAVHLYLGWETNSQLKCTLTLKPNDRQPVRKIAPWNQYHDTWNLSTSIRVQFAPDRLKRGMKRRTQVTEAPASIRRGGPRDSDPLPSWHHLSSESETPSRRLPTGNHKDPSNPLLKHDALGLSSCPLGPGSEAREGQRAARGAAHSSHQARSE
jgi:hypothetical protein